MTIFETIINALGLKSYDHLTMFSGAVVQMTKDDETTCIRFKILKGDDEYDEGEEEWIDLNRIDFNKTAEINKASETQTLELDPSKDWNYAVAEKLRLTAVSARDTFNEYISRKPKIEFSNL